MRDRALTVEADGIAYDFTFTRWENERAWYWECSIGGKLVGGGDDIFPTLREAKLAAFDAVKSYQAILANPSADTIRYYAAFLAAVAAQIRNGR